MQRGLTPYCTDCWFDGGGAKVIYYEQRHLLEDTDCTHPITKQARSLPDVRVTFEH
ncbi:hypothetical protein [Trichocoleus sp. DQ-U1]|uniref:hypothetical protein n=1 Tax=Trichocoleus sp. DQ-U1 TaxID=2933926 RepID=UPI003297031F